MKSEFQETINRISRARQASLLSETLPGDVTNDAPDFAPVDEKVADLQPSFRSSFDDTIVSRLANVLESYRGDVSEWAESEPEPSWREQFPSAMTMFLFVLGVTLVIGMNAFVITSQSSAQQQAIANLGSAVVLMLAGISLFYDRTVRGIGNDQVRYESGRRVEVVSDQISSLAALYGQWLIEWKQRQIHLADLQSDIDRERYMSRVSATFERGAEYAGVGVEAAVKDIEEEDVQQGSERVPLADRCADIKGVSQAMRSDHGATGAHQARADVLHCRAREAVPVESSADRVKLYRVVGLLHIVAHNMEGSATVAFE
jgi:hypothetical protein